MAIENTTYKGEMCNLQFIWCNFTVKKKGSSKHGNLSGCFILIGHVCLYLFTLTYFVSKASNSHSQAK